MPKPPANMPEYDEYEARHEAGRRKKRRRLPGSGCFGRLMSSVLGPFKLMLLLGMGIILGVVALQILSFLGDPIDNVLSIFGFESDSEPVVVDSRTIVLGIREMAVLQTATGSIQVDKTVVDTGPAPDAELRVVYIGYVTAGIDLALVTDTSIVTGADGAVTILLPPAQLTGCYLSKPDVVSRQCTEIPLAQDCGKIIDGLQDEAYDRAIDELRETALEMNLLDLAYAEAEGRIADLLESLGHTRVVFQRSPEPLPPDATCFPD